jgi:multidrug efflux pump subunit AcrA (membrane-fusion protein)
VKKRRIISVLCLILTCLLVFFSRTIYFYRLPEVRGVKPFRGFLNKMEISSGIADWAETETAYAVIGGTVDAVFVKEGDRVGEGQPLFQMGFDVEAAERKLREIQNNIRKLQADIDYTAVRPDLMSVDLDNARMALAEAELSYELGLKSRYALETARNNLSALSMKHEAEEKALRFDLEAKNIDLQNLRLQEESCRAALGDYLTYSVITAPAAGLVAEVNVKRGMYVQEKTPAILIGADGEFTVECTVSPENNFVLPGDSCELGNSAHVLTGLVSRVKPTEQGKTVSVTVYSDEVRPGETFEIVFEKNSAAAAVLIPNAALNQDNAGYYLNRVKRRKGILGEEYYVERLDVYIGDSDRANTAIIRGITFFEPVVLRSAKPVVSGGAVFLLNPGDFFEN